MNDNLLKALNRIEKLPKGAVGSLSVPELVARYRSDIDHMSQDLGTTLRLFFSALSLLKRDRFESSLAAFESAAENVTSNVYGQVVCMNYLVWAMALDMGEPIAVRYPTLFDPLLQIVESGIPFGVHKGELVVGEFAYPL